MAFLVLEVLSGLEIDGVYQIFTLFKKVADGGRTPCLLYTSCLRTASPQGIDAQASQGIVAPLTERSDETVSVGQFSSADWE